MVTFPRVPRLIARSVRVAALPVFVWLSSAAAQSQDQPSPNRLPTTREVPNAFGTVAYSVTTVSAVGFLPSTFLFYNTTGSLGRNGSANLLTDFFAPLDLPAGVVIDFIGLNSLTDTAFGLGVDLFERYADGSLTLIGTFSSTVHGWGMDYNVNPIGYLHVGNQGHALILRVQQAALPTLQFFGYVEVWWHRTVSPPTTQTFTDVPPSDFGYAYIEALASSGITGGCGGGNYCPDANLTRRQMAIFLAKALGLHWPN